MMKCKEFVYLLTSGQMKNATPVVRLDAFMHTAMCKRCRIFKANDQRLEGLLKDYRDGLVAPSDELT